MPFDTLIRLSQCNWPSSRLLLHRSTAVWRLRSGAPSQAFHLVQDVKWLQRACEQGALCESDQRKGLTLRTFRDSPNSNEGEGAVRVCKILQMILFLQFQRRPCETSIVEDLNSDIGGFVVHLDVRTAASWAVAIFPAHTEKDEHTHTHTQHFVFSLPSWLGCGHRLSTGYF